MKLITLFLDDVLGTSRIFPRTPFPISACPHFGAFCQFPVAMSLRATFAWSSRATFSLSWQQSPPMTMTQLAKDRGAKGRSNPVPGGPFQSSRVIHQYSVVSLRFVTEALPKVPSRNPLRSLGHRSLLAGGGKRGVHHQQRQDKELQQRAKAPNLAQPSSTGSFMKNPEINMISRTKYTRIQVISKESSNTNLDFA